MSLNRSSAIKNLNFSDGTNKTVGLQTDKHVSALQAADDTHREHRASIYYFVLSSPLGFCSRNNSNE
jgi:hypothetical protein